MQCLFCPRTVAHIFLEKANWFHIQQLTWLCVLHAHLIACGYYTDVSDAEASKCAVEPLSIASGLQIFRRKAALLKGQDYGPLPPLSNCDSVLNASQVFLRKAAPFLAKTNVPWFQAF